MATMQAVRIERPGVAHLITIDRPRPATGEVLVRVAATGICGSDVELLGGTRPAPYARYPIVPGHEWSGTIAELGPAVPGLDAGDRVVVEGFRACGRCDRCKEGRTNLCAADYAETGFTHQGAFAEYVCVPARLVHRLPPDADLEAAALLEPAACVAEGMLAAELRPGLRVAVVGAGTLGLIAVAILRLASPVELALFGTRASRLELGRRLGCTDAYDVNRDDPYDARADRYDLVFEAATRPDGARGALRLARRGGTVVLEGISGSAEPNLLADQFPLKHLRVQGVFGASGAAWRWVVQLFGSGQLDLGQLISHRFPLAEYDQAFAVLADRAAGALKVQLRP